MPNGDRLLPPEAGVTVRMYRQGHGDCFLIAFPRPGDGDNPYYVMIDCGYKPGSQAFLDHGKSIGDIVEHLHAACGGHLDLVILTHEHQDHLNGIWRSNSPYFKDFDIEEAWLAWTEDPDHRLAKELRKRHNDQLLGLLEARHALVDVADSDSTISRLDSLLGLELGVDPEGVDLAELRATAADPERSVNKQGMKLIKDKAAERKGYRFLRPGRKPSPLKGTDGIRAFVLGPPVRADLIADEDPHEGEGFPQEHAFSFGGAFRAAESEDERAAPFRRHFFVPLDLAFDGDAPFFTNHYGDDTEDDQRNMIEVPDDAPWRRIDHEWLYTAETLALKLNRGINNTSLVVAFELPKSKKVLLFAADAQRGSWYSWKDVRFDDGGETVTARDLLARTVLYKVGHHGSHNATLSGAAGAEVPNLNWMGQESAAAEFTAMITAVNSWAIAKRPPWIHPLPSIRAALASKAQGRVFQTDENIPAKPDDVSAGEWRRFTDRSVFSDLYFDYTVLDE